MPDLSCGAFLKRKEVQDRPGGESAEQRRTGGGNLQLPGGELNWLCGTSESQTERGAQPDGISFALALVGSEFVDWILVPAVWISLGLDGGLVGTGSLRA